MHLFCPNEPVLHALRQQRHTFRHGLANIFQYKPEEDQNSDVFALQKRDAFSFANF